jgi:hypothetical protein
LNSSVSMTCTVQLYGHLGSGWAKIGTGQIYIFEKKYYSNHIYLLGHVTHRFLVKNAV